MRLNNKMTPEELKEFRESRLWSQQTLADFLGVTIQAVRFWERGQRDVSVTTVRVIRLMQKYPQLIEEF